MNAKLIQIIAHLSEATRLSHELADQLAPLASLFADRPAQPEPKRLRKYRAIPEELRKQVLEMRKQGITLKECAVKAGLSETSVNRIVAQAKKRK